jgi:hypothetical protein
MASGVASCVASGARRVGRAWRGNVWWADVLHPAFEARVDGELLLQARSCHSWHHLDITSPKRGRGRGGVEGVGVGGHGMGESMDVGVRGWLRVG